MMLFRYVLTVLIALVNVVHYVMTMILMLVDVLQWPLRKRCVMGFVRLPSLLFKCVGPSTSSFFFFLIICFTIMMFVTGWNANIKWVKLKEAEGLSKTEYVL